MYHPRCYGSHYDIGFRYGSKLKKNHVVKQQIEKIDGFQLHYGTESEKILKQYFPEACDEMRGIADGLEVLYEKLAPWMMCISVCLEIPGCSMIAFKKRQKNYIWEK